MTELVSVTGVTDVPGPLYGASYDKTSKAFIFKNNATSNELTINELKRRISVLEDKVIDLTLKMSESRSL